MTEAGGVTERTRWAPWALTGAVSTAVLWAFLSAYPAHDLEPVGWDIFSYVWQTRLVGHGALAGAGPKPGIALLAATLGSLVRVGAAHEFVVLPPVVALALGLAVAALLRVSFRLPAWTVAVLAGVVALWPSTARVVIGYEANLLFLAIAVAGIALLLAAEGRGGVLAMAAVALAGAAITHIILYAVLTAAAGLYVLVSGPAFLRERREGVPLLATDAGAATMTVGAGLLAGAAAIYGWLGIRISQTLSTNGITWLFRGRTLDELHRIMLPVTAPVAAVGTAIGFAARGGRGGRMARAVVRFGLAWLVAALLGVAASFVRGRIPGARFLLFALPIQALVALGVVGVGLVVARGPRPGALRTAAAAIAVVLLGLTATIGGWRTVHGSVGSRTDPMWTVLPRAGAYLARAGTSRPVVFLVNSPTPHGAFLPKLYLNVARTAVPRDLVGRTFVYVGTVANLRAPRITTISPYPLHQKWRRGYNDLSREMWDLARPALSQDPVVLVLQIWDGAAYSALARSDPARVVAPGVFALAGPALAAPSPSSAAAGPPGTFPLPTAVAAAVAILALLELVGWGYARTALAGRGATALDVACLAPAVGAGLVVPPAFVLAVLGLDPGGVLGIVLLAAVAALGVGVAVRRVGGGAGHRARGASAPAGTAADPQPVAPRPGSGGSNAAGSAR